MLLVMVKLIASFSLELQNIWMFLKWLKNVKDSAVSDDILHCKSAIDFDHFDILASDVSKFNLLGKESLLIKHDNPVLSFPLE